MIFLALPNSCPGNHLFDKGPLFLQQRLGRGRRDEERRVRLDHGDEHLQVGQVDLEGQREILVELLHVLLENNDNDVIKMYYI